MSLKNLINDLLSDADERTEFESCQYYTDSFARTFERAICEYSDNILYALEDKLSYMTNGDITQLIYPSFKVNIAGDTVILEKHSPYCRMQFDITWWNTKYGK